MTFAAREGGKGRAEKTGGESLMKLNPFLHHEYFPHHQEDAGTYQSCLYPCFSVIHSLHQEEAHVWSVFKRSAGYKNGLRRGGELGGLSCMHALNLLSRWAAVGVGELLRVSCYIAAAKKALDERMTYIMRNRAWVMRILWSDSCSTCRCHLDRVKGLVNKPKTNECHCSL